MNESNIYSQIILSKTNMEIPVFKSGRTVDSRYDPKRESLKLLEQIKPDTHFIIVLGIAGGIFIQTLLEEKKDVFVLAVERSQADIDFLKGLCVVKGLLENKQVSFCTIDSLQQKIIELYVPAFYGNLQVIEQRGWTTENNDCLELINVSINKAAGIVSADFSVQSHFGKLWQHNILGNVKQLSKSFNLSKDLIPAQKTAIVLAAGPTLDTSIEMLKNNRTGFFVIATDTAFSVCVSSKLTPDVVISIDGQQVSNSHFIHSSDFDLSRIIFLFDLCANNSAVNKILSEKGRVCFFTSGHPLCEYINTQYKLNLPKLFSGSGTVTISAVDFAIKAGFNHIQILGADFAYINGKPYAKGTYLDRLYNNKANRLAPSGHAFCKLEFRTELLLQADNSFTTQILNAYRVSFEEYLKGLELSFTKQEDIYNINNPSGKYEFTNQKIPDTDIYEALIKEFENKDCTKQINSIFELTNSDICLLPLISWLRNHDNKDKTDFMFFYRRALGGIKK